ncbi:MAG: DUF4013 domain-containing protein [Thermoflexales bacterium]|nr:DUF4013 domain-containing protein [Thermoflexales bacterium]
MLDLDRAYRYLRSDPQWLNRVIIGTLISMVPILNFAVLGYQLEVARRARDNADGSLPTWDDFGGYIGRGAKVFVANLVFSLPVIIGLIVIVLAFYLPLIAGLVSASTATSARASSELAQRMTNQLLVSYGLAGCVWLPLTLYMSVPRILAPASFIQILNHDTIGAGLRVREMIALIKARPGTFLGLVALTTGAGAVYASAAIFSPLLLFFMMAATIILGHLYGQAARPVAPQPQPMVTSHVPPPPQA